MRSHLRRTLVGLVLALCLGGCCADPCDPLCPGDPCDPAVGPCDPCACRGPRRARLVPKGCSLWPGCTDPCDPSDPATDPCYRDPAAGIGDTPMTVLPGSTVRIGAPSEAAAGR